LRRTDLDIEIQATLRPVYRCVRSPGPENYIFTDLLVRFQKGREGETIRAGKKSRKVEVAPWTETATGQERRLDERNHE
jgi:hypothetical protein